MKKNYTIFLLLFGFLIVKAQQAPLASVHINAPSNVCTPGSCTDLFAEFYTPNATNNYAVSSIVYAPPFPFTGGTVLDASADDVWTPIVNLPFSFCFYGISYNQILVGSNGVITFDLTNQIPAMGCPWSFSGAIPNTTFPIRNAIYGVYQDTNIQTPPVTNSAVQNVNYYTLDTGVNAAPNRVFVANFNALPVYQCDTSVGLQTSQIVIHEGTNIIDIYVEKRTSCSGWNGGRGVIGIQNQAGTLATAPPARNTGTWSTTNEAWRFTPDGAPVSTLVTWSIDGIALPNHDNPLQVCPTEEHVYRAEVTYSDCGIPFTVYDEYSDPIIVAPLPVNNPSDISVCYNNSGIYTANIDMTAEMLGGTPNPADYSVKYYETLLDAQNDAINNISVPNLANYTFTQNQTIYVRVEDVVTTGCYNIKTFQLIVIPQVAPPTGESQQDFTAGQTLADLVVNGQNIVWYDAPTEGNQLPASTLLQNNVTYYAAQIQSGCESRNINATRLAVTVQLVLANTQFNNGMFSVYPNPAHSILNISFSNNLKSIEIFNAVGQKISAQYPDKKEVKLEISNLPVGVYFVKIDSGSKQKTVKIIKE